MPIALTDEGKVIYMKGRGVIALGLIFMVIMTSGVANAATGVTLDTDKSAYNEGEVVIITVTNNGDEMVTIPNGFWIENDAGEQIYLPNILFYMPPLDPGQSIDYTWDQTCTDGTMVPAGDYTVHTAWDSTSIKIFDSSTNGVKGKKVIDLPKPGQTSIFA